MKERASITGLLLPLVPVDTASIRNFSEITGSDPKSYINKLLEIAQKVEIR